MRRTRGDCRLDVRTASAQHRECRREQQRQVAIVINHQLPRKP